MSSTLRDRSSGSEAGAIIEEPVNFEKVPAGNKHWTARQLADL
jgi:hypothetical protein